jgi:hypothetical protein
MWINEGMTAFPNLKLKTVPGMDPIMQFQATPDVPDGDLGIARVDVSVSSCSRPFLDSSDHSEHSQAPGRRLRMRVSRSLLALWWDCVIERARKVVWTLPGCARIWERQELRTLVSSLASPGVIFCQPSAVGQWWSSN